MTEPEQPRTITITIPTPIVAPLGWAVDNPQMIQDLWDTFVKPEQDAGRPPSVEMRVLMAVLRALYVGLGGEQEP
jgi:hypothetical protein